MRYGKADIKGLKELRESFDRMPLPDEFMEACAKELAARLLRKVTKRTPVGEYPKSTGMTGGTLRRGWTGGKRSAAKGYAESLKVDHVGSAYVVEIINPTEYASYVEYGHRTSSHTGWVRGQFMMTISEEELQTTAPGILERKIQKYLKECFK